jgi:CheY-like chemotaxis protein
VCQPYFPETCDYHALAIDIGHYTRDELTHSAARKLVPNGVVGSVGFPTLLGTFWWSSTAAVFGLSSLPPAEERPSASPCPPAQRSSQPSKSEGSANPRPRTALLVEDNPADIFVIKEVVEGSGLNLTLRIASNGEDALRYLQDLEGSENPACPAIVLLDLNLPKVGGLEILRHLRNSSPCRHTPVIIVTSSTAAADRIAVQRLGAQAYFQKPNKLAAYRELGQLMKRILGPAE